jgi:TonB family protein
MRYRAAAFAFLAIVGASNQTDRSALRPKHIEFSSYNVIARVAHVDGDVTLDVAVDAEGNVTNAVAVSGPRILSDGALQNVRRWTFENPNRSPLSQRITYEYRIEGKGGEQAVSTVIFDPPGHVRVVVNPIPIIRN